MYNIKTEKVLFNLKCDLKVFLKILLNKYIY